MVVHHCSLAVTLNSSDELLFADQVFFCDPFDVPGTTAVLCGPREASLPDGPGLLQRDGDWLGAVAAEMGIHIDFMVYSSGDRYSRNSCCISTLGSFHRPFLTPRW